MSGRRLPPHMVGCRVYRSAALSVSNNSQTPIAFDAENFDPFNLHDTGSNTSRVLLPRIGGWLCSWFLTYASNASGIRDSTLALNGVAASVREVGAYGGGLSTYIGGTDVVTTTALTDYVELWPFQNSGGSLALGVGSAGVWLSVTYLGG